MALGLFAKANFKVKLILIFRKIGRWNFVPLFLAPDCFRWAGHQRDYIDDFPEQSQTERSKYKWATAKDQDCTIEVKNLWSRNSAALRVIIVCLSFHVLVVFASKSETEKIVGEAEDEQEFGGEWLNWVKSHLIVVLGVLLSNLVCKVAAIFTCLLISVNDREQLFSADVALSDSIRDDKAEQGHEKHRYQYAFLYKHHFLDHVRSSFKGVVIVSHTGLQLALITCELFGPCEHNGGEGDDGGHQPQVDEWVDVVAHAAE